MGVCWQTFFDGDFAKATRRARFLLSQGAQTRLLSGSLFHEKWTRLAHPGRQKTRFSPLAFGRGNFVTDSAILHRYQRILGLLAPWFPELETTGVCAATTTECGKNQRYSAPRRAPSSRKRVVGLFRLPLVVVARVFPEKQRKESFGDGPRLRQNPARAEESSRGPSQRGRPSGIGIRNGCSTSDEMSVMRGSHAGATDSGRTDDLYAVRGCL